MEVTMRTFCNKLIRFYDEWNRDYKRKIEHLTNEMKRYDEHLFCGNISYSYSYDAYCFDIGACYVSLFCSGGFQSTNLYISRNEDGVLVYSGYSPRMSSYPDSDALFHGCYEAFDSVYKCIEQLSRVIHDIEFYYKLDEFVFLIVQMNQYGVVFKISNDIACLRKHIVLKKENGWEPVFRYFLHDETENADEILSRYMDDSLIDVGKLDFLFQEPVKQTPKKKKESWFHKFFHN